MMMQLYTKNSVTHAMRMNRKAEKQKKRKKNRGEKIEKEKNHQKSRNEQSVSYFH